MHTWPSHHRPPNPTEGPSKQIKKSVTRNYPVLEHGVVDAATLVEKNGSLEWDSVVPARPVGRYHITQFLNVFPATKSPPLPELTATINQRADGGAHFLRKHFPEVDVSADVIRRQITEDTLQTTGYGNFDPFEGDTLDVVVDSNKTAHLIFPMGELNSELNLTPILIEDGDTTIKPTVTPVRTFSTPISQITSSPTANSQNDSQRDTLLCIRTYGATALLKFDLEATSLGGLTDITHFTRYDAGDASIMNVRILPAGAPFEVLLVNKEGGMYGCSLFGGKKTMVKLLTRPESSANTFWRVGQGSNLTECVILSEKNVDQLDFRQTSQISSLYTELSKEFLTAIEDYAQDNLLRLCSTSQITWLDLRFPGKPLLGYKHHRQFDRTLRTNTLDCRTATTILSSRRNGLMTIYSVSRHDDQLIRANDLPYGISLPTNYCQYTGQAFLQHESRGVTVFRNNERAEVHCVQLHNAMVDSELPDTLVLEESNAIKDLRKKAEDTKTDLEKYGDQDKSLKDLFPAYDLAFRIQTEQQAKAEEEQAEKFHDVMDRLPIFWQAHDPPSEHMLTSYDVVFRSHEDPDKISRSDFTTGSLINSTRGFRALVQDRFPIGILRKGAPWHLNIADIQSRIDPFLNLNMNTRDLAESLRSYDLIRDDDRTVLSIRRENNAREQLAADLVLSRDVYSPIAFMPPRDVGNDLETMTEALSLGGHDADEPPEVEFGYLRPVVKAKAGDHYNRDKEVEEYQVEEKVEAGAKVSLPMGVRLLLKDWEVGTKTKDYLFQDPYDTTDEPIPRSNVHPRLRGLNTMPNLSQPAPSQRPPMVIPSQSILSTTFVPSSQPSIKRPPTVVQSQDMLTFGRSNRIFGAQTQQPFVAGMSQSQASQDHSQPSQQYMASTQVLPGPHGGRPVAGRNAPNALGASTPNHPLYDPAVLNDALRRNKAVVCALSASYISTFAGYPLDSIKSRLQTTKGSITIPRLAGLVYKEEGIMGFYRGLWIPLMTISFVRAASFTIYSRTKEYCAGHDILCRPHILDAAITGGISGAMSGSLISFGSAPFELVKVRRQLEYSIAATKGVALIRPPGTAEAVREIFRTNGLGGLYTGFRLHFVRDTAGTALYFLEYDGMRHLLGRNRSGEQGPTPSWLPVHSSLVPFICGSVSGVTSWALIYPLDVVKTKVQQRALAGDKYRGPLETLHRLLRGPDPSNPRPLLSGIGRLYRGLGVSALRSITTHGLLWTLFDMTAHYIDNLPQSRPADDD
ncbi:hypothetical protein P691DRAFT_655672 [Macrolepiota fuliginosa MF-IS2]|uniref:Mitochondrial carrier n=1 Tax=Macrolepiota fuliginosa MF-IS2 TaxID=1400762 RepID=A0A9P5XPK1_9AGAR|nr:hypothetical protein P691DRAFT_655672 [Macrolepiota fuliginosa MF-IS2]